MSIFNEFWANRQEWEQWKEQGTTSAKHNSLGIYFATYEDMWYKCVVFNLPKQMTWDAEAMLAMLPTKDLNSFDTVCVKALVNGTWYRTTTKSKTEVVNHEEHMAVLRIQSAILKKFGSDFEAGHEEHLRG